MKAKASLYEPFIGFQNTLLNAAFIYVTCVRYINVSVLRLVSKILQIYHLYSYVFV